MAQPGHWQRTDMKFPSRKVQHSLLVCLGTCAPFLLHSWTGSRHTGYSSFCGARSANTGFQPRWSLASGLSARAQSGDAAGARQALEEETRMLRQTLETLVSEIRLLREELDPDTDGISQAASQAEDSHKRDAGVNGEPMAQQPMAQQYGGVNGEPVVQQPESPLPKASPPSPPVSPSPGDNLSGGSQKPPKGKTTVKVVSAGGDAGDIADFFLDDQKVPIGGMANRRGLNVVVIDPSAGQVQSAKAYDIWGNPLEENRRFSKDMKALDEDQVVLVALKDSGMENLDGTGLHALQSVGAELESRLGFRQGYALIGIKDGEALIEKKGPLVMAEVTLPFAVRPPQSPVRAPLR